MFGRSLGRVASRGLRADAKRLNEKANLLERMAKLKKEAAKKKK